VPFKGSGARRTFINDNQAQRSETDEAVTDGIEEDLKCRDDNTYVVEYQIPYLLGRPRFDAVGAAYQPRLQAGNLSSEDFVLLDGQWNRWG